ncbi:corticotropin-releasing factor-binding protein-like isoform X2 [Mercenaria mercenaria]|uniref:corticotropin-releasing factor-binding protein-like isoform X2 n=1 Tax=Mercenaria mercenaria TaxID=6596 RepID=UPI001E1DE74F|nr:corticotropin-releasing factor-binding protein-like isoform X2 [Mercenaria mercenaria]
MKSFAAVLLCAVHTVLITAHPALPVQKTDISLLRRQTRSVDGNIGCIHMESFPGELQYVSDGTEEVCGLYLIGQPDQIVEVGFLDFNVNCETGGVLALFDGWELQGELFPGVNDHALTLAERYTMFCGEKKPEAIFMSSQNVALIQFKIPNPGEGFKVFVNFKKNPQPCNAVAMFEMGTLTMKNYGLRRNCTTSIIYPEQISMINVDVGVTSATKPIEAEIGLTDKCMNYGGGDYIQVMNGNGLDPSTMATKGVLCGMDSNSEANAKFVLHCQHSVVRMVSSGEFHNTVTFQYAPPKEEELNASDMC